ncbi:TPA: hypothetical protein WN616_000748 [Neisseria gonorrhoeae]|uniref:hypothetical protein n=1 Tax=Neisseria gonorrhoeae TaxID=485 RepID=UPI000E5829B6|nr:hypothetical protein [Neisseria gonorrhoeae]MBT8011436.1 hypothetical protein [Neisseria gonorrhoeae]MBT8030278.1 hypothetical protein [Neisseria gonorrhoeae]MBT8032493.1 hypothetical protein [Neisseria gonorrhoeae]ROU58753.1 hypothetical protein EGO73_04940 [Neisseria gonorrhoeae]TND61585.1 hypothetical protein EPH30_03445 [Neisseria gonorrhoeae]
MVDAVVKTPEFLPFTSVGIFRFGADITEYKNILETFMYEPPDEFGTEYYESPDSNLLISVKKNKIISIFCYQELYFMGVNIIGLNFEIFKQLFHYPKLNDIDKCYLSNESYPTYVYEFDEIGVQAWEAKGKIVTIIAGGKDNYSTEPYYDE